MIIYDQFGGQDKFDGDDQKTLILFSLKEIKFPPPTIEEKIITLTI